MVCPSSLTLTAKVCRYLQDTWQTASPNILRFWKYTYFRFVFEEYFYWVQNSRMAVIQHFKNVISQSSVHSFWLLVFIVENPSILQQFLSTKAKFFALYIAASFHEPRYGKYFMGEKATEHQLTSAQFSPLWNQPLGLCFYPVPFPTQGL